MPFIQRQEKTRYCPEHYGSTTNEVRGTFMSMCLRFILKGWQKSAGGRRAMPEKIQQLRDANPCARLVAMNKKQKGIQNMF